MTLRDLFESGIVIEGYRKIQCWDNEDSPVIYHEGYDEGNIEELMDRKIAYMFPYNPSPNSAAICIELAEE